MSSWPRRGGPLRYSIAGAALTAVPGGVWASFRTGSLGQSVLLRAPGLSVVAAAGAGTPGSTPYYWAMSSGSAYSGGVLWEEAFGGLVACISAATGKVLAEEAVSSPAAQLSDLLSADAAGRQLTGVVVSGPSAALVAITPPAAC